MERKLSGIKKLGIAALAWATLLPLYVTGCSSPEKPRTDYEFITIREEPNYEELRRAYSSIDITKLPEDEQNWLANLKEPDRKELLENLKTEMPKTTKMLEDICKADNCKLKDCDKVLVLMHRSLAPLTQYHELMKIPNEGQ